MYRLVGVLVAIAGARACSFGEEPGTWSRTQWDNVPGRGTTLDYFRLDDSKESVWLPGSKEPPDTPFGSAWQTLNPDCQLENLLRPYLDSTAPIGKNITIAFLGDSNDEHELDFLCAAYHQRHGYGHWLAYVHSHRTVNYCILDSGLTLVQLYSMAIVEEEERGFVRTLRNFFSGDDSEAYALWDGFAGTNGTLVGRDRDVKRIFGREPALVVCSNTYWALNGFASRDEAAKLVDPRYLSNYMRAMHTLVGAVRENFPQSKVALRTSHQVRSNCEDGDTTQRAWGKRAWVAQINAAKRAVAHTERRKGHDVQLIDGELLAAAFTPTQSSHDDIHYKAWLGLELMNLYLNIASD
jgi:hypothetical protein